MEWSVILQIRSCLRIKKLAAYIILGVNADGYKEVLSITVGENESAKYCHYGIIISNSKTV